jgi:sugar lactone lactonase YvrE
LTACSDTEDAVPNDAGISHPDANTPSDGGETPDAGGAPDAELARITMFSGSSGSTGNLDGPRLEARLGGPSSMARAPDGTVFIADTSNYVIRKIAPNGEVSTLAGKAGVDGTTDGSGEAARFSLPVSIALNPAGELIVSDSYAGTLRKVTIEGTVSTWAGVAGELDHVDGPVATARFRAPEGLAFDGDGNLYVVDREAHTVRKIDPNGMVSTYAGTKDVFGSTDGDRAIALFNQPFGLAVHDDGTVAIADAGNNTIRLIGSDGVVRTLAGTPGEPQGTADGVGPAARFGRPRALAYLDNGDLLVADTFNDRLRAITPEGAVTTYAGSFAGSKDGALNEATFSFSTGLLNSSDAIYVADTGSSIIRKIAAGQVETFAGKAVELALLDGPATDARFFAPAGLLALENGEVLVADTYNNAVRKIAVDGTVETISDEYNLPRNLLSDRQGGYYVADSANNVIQHVDADGQVTLFAGGEVSRGETYQDGPRLEALFLSPGAMVMDSAGNIYVSDAGNHAIRKIDVDGMVSTVAGDTRPGYVDGIGTETRFNLPDGLLLLDDTTLIVADALNHVLRRIMLTETGAVVSLFAGTHPDELEFPKPGDHDGERFQASFNTPRGLLLDGDSILVTDTNNSLIRRVALADASVSTVAGTRGRLGISERELPGTLFEPQGMVRMPDESVVVTFQGGLLKVFGM